MGKTFIRRRRIHIRKHYPKREVFKAEDGISKVGSKHLRVCPCCGRQEYHVVSSRWNWLLGQRFKCERTGYVFKQPFTEMEYQRARRFERRRR